MLAANIIICFKLDTISPRQGAQALYGTKLLCTSTLKLLVQ